MQNQMVVIALKFNPNNNFINEFHDFMGPFELYKKFDFMAEKEIKNTIIM